MPAAITSNGRNHLDAFHSDPRKHGAADLGRFASYPTASGIEVAKRRLVRDPEPDDRWGFSATGPDKPLAGSRRAREQEDTQHRRHTSEEHRPAPS
jgi:hypothetical protein